MVSNRCRYHNAAVTEYGLLYCWGAGENGQLGLDIEHDVCLPTLVTKLTHVVTGLVACGEHHTVALTSGEGLGSQRLPGPCQTMHD